MTAKPPQFGYIYLFGRFWDVDPIGLWLGKLKNKEWWYKWDRFYRCRLGIQNKFYKLESKRYDRTAYD